MTDDASKQRSAGKRWTLHRDNLLAHPASFGTIHADFRECYEAGRPDAEECRHTEHRDFVEASAYDALAAKLADCEDYGEKSEDARIALVKEMETLSRKLAAMERERNEAVAMLRDALDSMNGGPTRLGTMTRIADLLAALADERYPETTKIVVPPLSGGDHD